MHNKYKAVPLDLNQLTKIINKNRNEGKELKVYPCRKTGSTFVSEHWKIPSSAHISLNPKRSIGGNSNLVKKIEKNDNEFRIGLIRHPFHLLRSYCLHSYSGVAGCTSNVRVEHIPEQLIQHWESLPSNVMDGDFLRVFQKDNPYNDIHTPAGSTCMNVLIKTEFLTEVTEQVMRPIGLLSLSKSESLKKGGHYFRNFNSDEIKPSNTMSNPEKKPSFERFFFSKSQSKWTEKLYTIWKPWFDKFHYGKHGSNTSDIVAFLIHEENDRI